MGVAGPESRAQVALVNFDAWHRAAAFGPAAAGAQRYMLKFQAARMAPPDGPSWAHLAVTAPIGDESGAEVFVRGQTSLHAFRWK